MNIFPKDWTLSVAVSHAILIKEGNNSTPNSQAAELSRRKCHQPTRRKEKCLINFKSAPGAQGLLALMGKVHSIFSIEVGRYTKGASDQRLAFAGAKTIWLEAASQLLYV